MPMDRPSTHESYVELVNQAVMDAEDLRSAIEYDEEYMGDAMGIAETLEGHLKSLHEAMQNGSYTHADEDLAFMEIVNTAPDVWVPFKPLLRLINQTHRQGLETE